ncbi:MAG: hypothetical protein GXP55_07170 [Deltaproteobacteria bacterium]|nr:hypothetical protein [Deltaproteobacteria bacterium]
MRANRDLCLIACGLLLACGGERPPPQLSSTPARSEAEQASEPAPAPGRESLADCDRGGAFLELWDGLDAAERQALTRAEDSSLALQARWETSRRVLEAEGDGPQALDATRVASFVAFFERRTGATPPAWWGQSLAHARYHAATGATSYADVPSRLESGYAPESTLGERHVRAPVGWHVQAAEHQTAIRLASDLADSVSHVLPLDALELSPGRWATHVALVATDRGLVVMPFEPGDGGGAEVVRRYDEGQRMWETRVCAGGRSMLGGLGTEMLELRLVGALVLAFGAESHAVWVDALRVEDGSLAWRFNSDLWFARHAITGSRGTRP